jgi:hypothetical protein
MKLRFIPLLLILTSCSFFQTQDSGNYSKSTSVENRMLKMNLSPWSTVKNEGSDFSLINNLTKSYFLFNSACRRNELSTLKTLTSSIFAGIDELEYLDKTTITHQDRDASLVTASGKVDGITRYFRVLTTQKNSCIYDYVLISINKITLDKDTTDFNSFTQNIILK